MANTYRRVFLVDTENQGTSYLKDLMDLTNNDLVICIYTKYSTKFSYDQIENFIESKAAFKFISCRAGTPNALDFQLSTILGYMLRQTEETGEDTEYIILSHDTGYYSIVHFWQSKGYNVNIKGAMNTGNVNVVAALAHLDSRKIEKAEEVAANKAGMSGNSKAGGKNQTIPKVVHSALDKFNKRLETTNQLQSENNTAKPVKVLQESVEKPSSRVLNLADLGKLFNFPESTIESIELSDITGETDEKSEELITHEVSKVDIKVEEAVDTVVKSEDVEKKEEGTGEESVNNEPSIVDIKEETIEEVKEVKQEVIEPTTVRKPNEELILLSAGNNGTIYNNILARYHHLADKYEKIEKNAFKVAKFTRLNMVDSLIAGFIIYVANDTEEIRKSLQKVLSGDSKTLVINTIVKRVEQRHFLNKNDN